MAKETRLNDSAEIYVKREKQTERQKISEMTTKEKIAYFNMYYTKKVLIGLVGICLLGYILYTTLSPKPEELLNVAVINEYYDQEHIKSFLDDLNQYFNVDPDNQKINYDYSYYMSDNDVTGNTTSSTQKLSTYVAVNQIDVIIADEDTFKDLTTVGYFINLADILPADMYTRLADHYYNGIIQDEVLQDKEDPGAEKAYGIYLTDSSVYKSSGSTLDKPILGIVSNTPHDENVISFVRYLMGMNN